ncbi:MAG: GNAT family N-acetyltransferase [Candidatus Cloacimonetes bacterium]|nr:GNAT family N-acetyltransferase [Candidatus Cloacimonadota bacterium]MCK9335873.1 GNAT family N-acetyltransferase [Candidatus Cloacimonadota bacterium]MDD2684161.1 GNAT family N-acetyltransferase [Candidatus Cloacimonadota bacterium]MDD3097359.1 GNAT family N-acetyltransferase [Candidatus Cloacimonadota bacterium]MDD4035049.1 GNAT family N-acetyltransferase [Candidatus Cloacimonadota bacterium]
MKIRSYDKSKDEARLMQMLEEEGEDWACYWADSVSAKYREALAASITYVAYDGQILCGYSRSLEDCGFYIYVCDLLVKPQYRGQNLGRKLMEIIYRDHPHTTVYVMSDVDGYYSQLGYHCEGSVYEVSRSD